MLDRLGWKRCIQTSHQPMDHHLRGGYHSAFEGQASACPTWLASSASRLQARGGETSGSKVASQHPIAPCSSALFDPRLRTGRNGFYLPGPEYYRSYPSFTEGLCTLVLFSLVAASVASGFSPPLNFDGAPGGSRLVAAPNCWDAGWVGNLVVEGSDRVSSDRRTARPREGKVHEIVYNRKARERAWV